MRTGGFRNKNAVGRSEPRKKRPAPNGPKKREEQGRRVDVRVWGRGATKKGVRVRGGIRKFRSGVQW